MALLKFWDKLDLDGDEEGSDSNQDAPVAD